MKLLAERISKYFLQVWPVFVLFASCSVPPVLEDQLCIPFIDSCKPGSFTETLIDTGSIAKDGYRYFIEMLPRPVNTDANDHALFFYGGGKNRLALVSNDSTSLGIDRVSVFPSPGYIPGSRMETLQQSNTNGSLGTPWYSLADKKMYFTAKSTTDDPSDYDIYQTSYDQGALGSAEAIESIHLENVFDAQPTISPDGKYMYFVSERAGGSGGVDIWMSSRSGGTWSSARHLPTINTLCNELSPSVSYDGKWLYFASNGHATVGGYDIFRARISNAGIPEAPENIGRKVNTTYDELFPYQPADTLLYYSSDQPASIGKRNLYVLRRSRTGATIATREEEGDRPNFGAINDPTIRVEGNVVIAGDTGNVDAEVFWRDPKKDVELGRKATDTSGNYSIDVPRGKEYDIGAESKDKFYDVRRVDTRNVDDSVLQVPTLVIGDTLILRINFPFDNYTTPYDFTVGANGEQTPVRWQTHIDLIARSIKKDSKRLIRVVLHGHTDTVGTIEYNDQLARNRAQFIRKELIKRGIAGSMIQVDPKGELQPLAKREEESLETFHLRLRRVEIVKILK